MNAREAAVDTLIRVMRFDAYANLAVREKASELADERERDFYTKLVYGTLERRFMLTHVLSGFCRMKKLPDTVVECLYTGAYQILFMDSVPAHAAVSESVRIARRRAPKLAGMVNAVLRNVAKNTWSELIPKEEPQRTGCFLNLPDFLAEKYAGIYGAADGFEEALPFCIRVRDREKTDEILKMIREKGGQANQRFENCFEVENAGDLTKTSLYEEGAFVIQSAASQLIARVAAPERGMKVLDACAAPGGKSFAMADMMRDEGQIDAVDLHEHRTRLIRNEQKRLGISCISANCGDALVLDGFEAGSYDVVLTDVPCSGLSAPGKPEIALRITQEDIESLSGIQRRILDHASAYVKKGGALVYSTCTWTREEDEMQITRFLEEHPDFALDDPGKFIPEEIKASVAGCGGMLRFDRKRDGVAPFFAVRMIRG